MHERFLLTNAFGSVASRSTVRVIRVYRSNYTGALKAFMYDVSGFLFYFILILLLLLFFCITKPTALRESVSSQSVTYC